MRALHSLRTTILRKAGEPDLFGSERSFRPPIGRFWQEAEPGYFIDFTLKVSDGAWPPYWLARREQQLHVATIQWALGCYECYLKGLGDRFLRGALDASDYLCEIQERDGVQKGGWTHLFPMRHTYKIAPPWLSAMAQGEGASLLARMALVSGQPRYERAAREALLPLSLPSDEGGTLAFVDGRPVLEEYPSSPPSYVLNGAIFALWGLRDVGELLEDAAATTRFNSHADALAETLPRFDTGWWSRYCLYPHPIANIASPAYHLLHIRQLKVMEELTGQAEFGLMARRFESYRRSRPRRSLAITAKVAFRVTRPRSTRFARIWMSNDWRST